jgi:hypothetical protein
MSHSLSDMRLNTIQNIFGTDPIQSSLRDDCRGNCEFRGMNPTATINRGYATTARL